MPTICSSSTKHDWTGHQGLRPGWRICAICHLISPGFEEDALSDAVFDAAPMPTQVLACGQCSGLGANLTGGCPSCGKLGDLSCRLRRVPPGSAASNPRRAPLLHR